MIIDKIQLSSILSEWNFWQKEIDTGIERKEYLRLIKELSQNKQILVITGARRAGKSFILRQYAKKLIYEGKPKNEILIVNFEDPRLPLSGPALDKIFETYVEYMQPKNKPVLFLDEIQEVEGWEKWVATTQELDRAQVIISGSNANLLSRELSTMLTGRHQDITVFPLSFAEFLNFHKVTIKNKKDEVLQQSRINSLEREYLQNGSFPATVFSQNKISLLLEYFSDVVEKDIIKRYSIRKKEDLKSLLKFYLSNPSSSISYTSLEKYLGISSDTIEKFSSYFEEAYLVFFLKRFSWQIKEQEKSPRKVYAIDLGLANAIGFHYTQNLGKLLENAVFLLLKRQQELNFYLELYYWKNQIHKEVDFVVKERNRVTRLIQVCADPANYKTKKREIQNLLLAMNEFGLNESMIVTLEKEGVEEYKGKTITYIPFQKLALQ